MVTCTIKPEVGDVTGVTGSNLPIITKRTAESTVRIADGEVIAIGGLLQDVRRETKRKIPLLGDLPLIGPLFRNTTTDNDTREVVIFIVPHILDQSGRFTGPLLLDRVSEGQLGALDAGMVVPEQETRAEAERRRELIRERVRQREAATQPPS
jgi:type II secretory pathway component GspD/PulD (secretin)